MFLLAVNFQLRAQLPCIDIDVTGSDTICQGNCTALAVDVTGSVSTTNYTVQGIPYSPYPFTGGNPVLVNLDDLWSPAITIPFCFEFYGSLYSQLIVGTNGLVSFDVAQANGVCPWTINTPIPNPVLPMNCIMAPYHDINPTLPTAAGQTEINWQVYGTAPCRTMVITWNDVAQFGTGCDTLASTMQVVLHETTYIIDIFIADKPLCTLWNNGAAIEGLHNATGTAATVVPGRNYPTTWSASTDGVRFQPAGSPYYAIQWLDPSNNVIGTTSLVSVCPAQTTTYTVNVTLTFCAGPPVTITDQVTIYVTQSTLNATSTFTHPLCTGVCDGAANVIVTSGSPPYTYNWTPALPPVPNQSGLCAGQYTCTVTESTGCTIQVTFSLTQQIPFSIAVSTTPTICGSNTGTASVTVTGGSGVYTYEWSTGDTTTMIDSLIAGGYQVVVTDSLGCQDSILAVVGSTGLAVTSQATTVLCFGDSTATASVTVTSGTPPYSYQWMPYGGNQATATGLGVAVFMCMITDATGCSTTLIVPVTGPPPLTVLPSANMTVCTGESVTITAVVQGGTGPYTYNWSHGFPNVPTWTFTPQQTDTYTVQVVDANGCAAQPQTTQVKLNPVPVANFYALEPTCPPAEVAFTNLTDTAVSYQWFFDDPASGAQDTSTLEDPTHLYNSSGTYNVTLIATNVWGCSDTITQPIAPVPATPNTQVAAVPQQVTILNASTSIVNSTQGGVTYCVYFGDGDSLCTSSMGPYPHTYDSLGVYTVMLVAWNQDGCPDTAFTQVAVEEPTTCYIPNAFTPNGTGLNDQFLAYGINVEDFHLRVYDRWGMLLFESRDIYRGWDGTFQGNKCQEDVYVWKLTYTDNFGELNVKYGHVALIR